MTSRYLFLAILALALSLPHLPAQVAAQGGSDRIVVLKNGRVLRGKVTYLGDRCLIALAGGGEIRLPTKDLSADCESLESAYLRMRDGLVSPRQVKSRLELASWCLREGLLEQATAELLVAMQLNPQHPDIEPLYRQLKYLGDKRAAAAAKAESTPPATAATTASPTAAARSVPVDDLEVTMKSLRKDVVAEFPSAIQPLLMNRCAGGRCHEGNSPAAFKLLRPTQGNDYWRRLTLRNLQSVLEQVDRANPNSSPLLVQASQPHGGLTTPVFGEKDLGQFQALVDWVRRASYQTDVASTPSPPEASWAGLEEPAEAPTATVAPAAASDTRPASAMDPVTAPSRDPFDPEVFNRQTGRGPESDRR